MDTEYFKFMLPFVLMASGAMFFTALLAVYPVFSMVLLLIGSIYFLMLLSLDSRKKALIATIMFCILLSAGFWIMDFLPGLRHFFDRPPLYIVFFIPLPPILLSIGSFVYRQFLISSAAEKAEKSMAMFGGYIRGFKKGQWSLVFMRSELSAEFREESLYKNLSFYWGLHVEGPFITKTHCITRITAGLKNLSEERSGKKAVNHFSDYSMELRRINVLEELFRRVDIIHPRNTSFDYAFSVVNNTNISLTKCLKELICKSDIEYLCLTKHLITLEMRGIRTDLQKPVQILIELEKSL